MAVDVDGLEVLSEEECRTLLGSQTIGRVAISVRALPVVLPVNYRVVGDTILFFTAAGMKLRAAAGNLVVGFEVDRFDFDNETGWSVMVVGVLSEVTDPDALAAATRLGVRPWAGGPRSHLVQLGTEFVSGRRIAHPAATSSS